LAEYRLSANIIGRSAGRSSVAAAAYRAGIQLHDERTGLDHDYTRKRGVLHTEILAPDNAPDWMKDRAKLWNAVEAVERRKDAQLSREIQLSLPHELDAEQNQKLALSFIQTHFVDQGMIADVAIHAPDRQGDQRNIHAHVMLTLRELTGDGFASKKNREWNKKDNLGTWRAAWADHQNEEFQRLGMEQRVDHRSYEDRGIDKEPTQHLGPVANDMEKKGKSSRIGDENRERQQRNAERAALAQESAQTTRALAVEAQRQSEHVATKKAELHSHLLQDQIEAERRADRAMLQLEEQQRQRNGERTAMLEEQRRQLEKQLQADGWRKLMRDFIGKTARDQQELEATRLNLASIKQREDEERSALSLQHEREKLNREAEQHSREREYAEKLQVDRQTALERAKGPENAAPTPTPSNDVRKPFWRRQKVLEQDNRPETTQDFNNASQTASEPPQATDKQRAIEDHKTRMRERLAKDRERGRDGYDYD